MKGTKSCSANSFRVGTQVAPHDFLYNTPSADFIGDLQRFISVDALQAVSWPDGDLFPQYLPSGGPEAAPGGGVSAASGQVAAIVPGETGTIYGTYLGPPNGVSPPASEDDPPGCI